MWRLMASGFLAAALTTFVSFGFVSLGGVASAQNLSLQAPAWASRLTAADILPTTGGRAALAGDGIELSVRATIAPEHGGVARVVRYQATRAGAQLFVRRFTGHPTAGWWIYGADTPLVLTPAASVREEIERLARAAQRADATDAASCNGGERVFLEIVVRDRSESIPLSCLGTGAGGVLAQRLSDLAGSRTEDELAEAAVAELLNVDRAFARVASSEGAPAAFARYAAQDARLVTGGRPVVTGPEAVAAAMAPVGRVSWTPEGARVSARGDMGWTWGTVAAGAQRLQYVTVWTRDYEGAWKFSADISTPAP